MRLAGFLPQLVGLPLQEHGRVGFAKDDQTNDGGDSRGN
jgi:hypothetical protein